MLPVALASLCATACWNSTAEERDAGRGRGDADAGTADALPDVADVTLEEDAIGDREADAASEDAFEHGEDVEDDAGDGDDGWPSLPPGCIDSHVFPDGSVSCSRGVPRCPEVFSYCCDTNLCGSLEFGARGCCTEPDCGDPGDFHCIEAIGGSLPQICTRPEPDFRCPLERPFCCFNVLGAAVCADHALSGWDSCEDQSATGSGP